MVEYYVVFGFAVFLLISEYGDILNLFIKLRALVPMTSLLPSLATKIYLWEKLVIGGSLLRSKLSASFHPHPDPPQVPLKTYVNASSDRRRQHVANLVHLNLSIRTSINTSESI